ncbi:poly(R)-hydroxyalkanoic acid synthase subunit PhaE [Ruegeria sp. EL01]|jgi:hypothetical protein|uniref:poly(R)-hydroxyalkanoic acid synthase subunit PhaE n=1 Tax=Ruegeria sp. EL01 TaxID=2107578 RepID=UPI0013C4B415|nr:poly(R)-hydroxyalkanoic acid synthase subunit PhaE [Ruegeria sp. EL01]
MTGTKNPMDKAFAAMMEQQSHLLRSYSEYWENAVEAGQSDTLNPFDAFQKSMADFTAAMPKPSWLQEDGILSETLEKMMNPARMMQAGSADLSRTLQKLVEAPELSDIGTLERQGLKGLKEWLALKEAGAAYQAVIAKAWSRAFETFSGEVSKTPDIWQDGPRSVTNKWFATLNDELIRTQRTQGFLDAHRALLRSSVEYRLAERNMMEAWCEARSMPTRTEVDDLHKTVYALRKELRTLKKEIAAAKDKAPAKTSGKRAAKNG